VRAEPLVAGGGYRPGEAYTHRLISRRMLEVNNSTGQELAPLRQKRPYNPAWMSPVDLEKLGLRPGDRIELRSPRGAIEALCGADPGLPSGVVSMAHAWGGAPGAESDLRADGSCVAALVDTTRDFDPISGMARQSAIPVNVRAMPAAVAPASD
jgi:anaerobic selenocysteine-containing dehydrogenase